jgi:hypothetical protein
MYGKKYIQKNIREASTTETPNILTSMNTYM